MLFNSIDFLLFFPIVVILYFILPKRIRQYWLLLSSYYFYMSWNAKYAVLILFSTIVTYLSGLVIEKIGRKKWIVAGSIIANLSMLFYFKYTNFSLSIIQQTLAKFGVVLNIPEFDIILPVGISFFTFQALSYTIDVYRGDIEAEHNFFRYALFVSFFPQLVAGPIEKSKNLLKQLKEESVFDFDRFRNGILMMIWGFFLKIVIADRIAVYVDCVYGDPYTYAGWYIVIASALFAIQIYCDFYGYSSIAKGAACVLGIDLTENFDAPYISSSVSEFWRRWHISLMVWFKDYLYIPLGGNKKGKIRKYVNEMIVFLLSGLWHGASLAFVVWGGLNGLYQVIGEALEPTRKKVLEVLHIHRDKGGYKLLRVISTFVLVDFAWIFFRAGRLTDAMTIVKQMISVRNPWIFYDGTIYDCGLDARNFWLAIICIGILIVADICKYKGIELRRIVLAQDYLFRWVAIALFILLISIFGLWGAEYNAANFIYFQF